MATTSPRPPWPELFLATATLISQRGSCKKRKVGCVIVSEDNRILATGYNGAPSKLKHCLEIGCDLDETGKCIRAVHAEINALLNAAKYGVRLEGARLYCTDRPCLNCANALVQAGIVLVHCMRDDLESPTREKVLKLFFDARVHFLSDAL